jgi:broad specificity phosphatase PhoE
VRLLWIRHGQMDVRAHHARDVDALNRLFSQEVQGCLTERGRREAADVARVLASRRIDHLVSSPLVRARETGEVVAAALGRELEIRDEIVELRTGALLPRSRSARLIGALAGSPLPPGPKRAVLSALTVPLYFRAWRSGLTEGGESREDFEGRVQRVFDDLRATRGPDDVVALFAHGYLIASLAYRIATTPRQRWLVWRKPYIPNGGITEIDLAPSGAATLVSYAEASHLRP